MRVGIDFDNTIAGYDRLFVTLAREAGLVPPGFAAGDRVGLRDRLRGRGEDGEIAWQVLQARAYGPRMAEAEPMAGISLFLAACRNRGVEVCVVSHKTRYARRDEERRWDMRATALAWLEARGLFGPAGLVREQVFFEETRDAKIARITALACDHFVDDLEEVFAHPRFPADVVRHLLAPGARRRTVTEPDGRTLRIQPSWHDIHDDLFSADDRPG